MGYPAELNESMGAAADGACHVYINKHCHECSPFCLMSLKLLFPLLLVHNDNHLKKKFNRKSQKRYHPKIRKPDSFRIRFSDWFDFLFDD